jgi:hypothetical protein
MANPTVTVTPDGPACQVCKAQNIDLDKGYHQHHHRFPWLIAYTGRFYSIRPPSMGEEFTQEAKVQENAVNYHSQIIWIVEQLRWTRTGTVIIGAMDRICQPNGKYVVIQPYSKWENWSVLGDPKDSVVAVCTATAGPKQNPNHKGTHAEVSFSPESREAGTVCNWWGKHMAGLSNWTEKDEALLHELVHAFGTLTGLWDVRRVDDQMFRQDNFKYDNLEEFLAILVSNMFRSEKGRRGLQTFEHLMELGVEMEVITGASATSDGFLGQVWNSATPKPFIRGANKTRIRALAKLHSQEPKLFNELSTVSAAFNPVRQYMTYKKIYDNEIGL